jgi:hypothetical protein
MKNVQFVMVAWRWRWRGGGREKIYQAYNPKAAKKELKSSGCKICYEKGTALFPKDLDHQSGDATIYL